MEQTTEHAAVDVTDEMPAGPISKGAQKVERIAQQSKGLFDDVKDWIDLKIKLTELEIREKIKAKQDDAVAFSIVGFLGLLGGVFALITGALGLGAWLGHPAWGFLIVTGLLFATAGLVYWSHFSRGKKITVPPGVSSEHKQLAAEAEQKKLPAGSPAS